MEKSSTICVAGSNLLIGSAIARELDTRGHERVFGPDGQPDLTEPRAVHEYFASVAPEFVFLVGGKSGGIAANLKYPAELIRNNLLVECNVIHAAHCAGASKLLYLASSCSYPKDCVQPMQVESLMTGPLEPTSEPYAVAKLAGISLCQAYRTQYGANFICGIPADAFGPGDDFSLDDSHVVAALIRRMHEAKQAGAPFVEVWGTGKPNREFIYADDLADACILVMDRYEERAPINLAGGQEHSIAELAGRVQRVVGYAGEIRFDSTRPDGMPRKTLDSHRLRQLGWRPQTDFSVGLADTYAFYLRHPSRDCASDGLRPVSDQGATERESGLRTSGRANGG